MKMIIEPWQAVNGDTTQGNSGRYNELQHSGIY
jgi:hypothetical protein